MIKVSATIEFLTYRYVMQGGIMTLIVNCAILMPMSTSEIVGIGIAYIQLNNVQ